ncbi:DUF6776 family protein [Alteromonas sp. KUL49]|uniref:DUF6776 family protein n=1 Tax=Alteromonas sp. KUL49 TaxID=2480798 RepID=UPI00102F0ADC|nr:DUF6776 family protein [Alteromonas sp. KUL49]TAP38606.1 hypothetical protein EYS00_14440 [Alteromonas sp. KUL49]GEA12543.1 hypothetical protein KUL49_29180 [Alteromonas sp. KUL49]
MTTDQLKHFLGNHKWSLLVGISMILMLGFGYKLAHLEERYQLQALDAAETTLALLDQENSELTTQVNQLEVALSVVSMEKESLLSEITMLKGEMVELEQQNAFYQRVVSPEKSQEGFIVDDVLVENTPNGAFGLRFVLLQQKQNRAVVNGNLSVTLKGTNDGETFDLTTGDADFVESPIAYRFRYFQAVNLEFTLPDGAVIDEIKFSTTVYQYQRRVGVYEVSYDWNEALLDSQ